MAVATSGISGLDELLEGGFPRGGVIAIGGPTGSGKTLLALQFLYYGVTHGEASFYISFDERKRLLYRNVARLGWNFQAHEAAKRFVFLEFPVHEAATFVAQESMLFNMIVELGIERLVIDPITPLILLHADEQKRRVELLRIVNMLRSWGTTTLLVVEEDEKSAGIEPICDGIIKLYNIQKENYRIRALEVVKMRGVAHAQRMCPIRITKSGIEVYPYQYLYL